MIWEEMIIKDPISNKQIKPVLSRLFSVSSDFIYITSDISKFADLPKKYKVIVHSVEMDGDFKRKLSVYQLGDLTFNQTEQMLLVKQFVRELGTSCLISDDTLNPFRMIHVDSLGNETVVFLDLDVDEEDRIVIQK